VKIGLDMWEGLFASGGRFEGTFRSGM